MKNLTKELNFSFASVQVYDVGHCYLRSSLLNYSDKKYCAQLLLNSIGASNFIMISALGAPKEPSELTYAELIEMLEKHLAPKRHILVAQHQFISKYQTSEQKIADFIATLRSELNDCDFILQCECKVSIAHTFLRAQFIHGLCDNCICEQLLQSDKVAFNELVLKAITLESSKADLKALVQRSQSGGTSTTVDISKVYQGKKNTKSRTKVVKFKVDSGAAYSFLPRNVYAGLNLGVTMHQPDISFQSYTHNVFVPDGKINIKAEFYGTDINDQLYIVPETYDAIAGRVWISKFGLDLCNLDTHATDVSTVKLIDTIENMDQVAQMYPVLCNGKIGKIPDFVVSLKLRKGAQPVFHRKCDVSYAFVKKVDAELDTLEAETSDWVSPLVVIPKADVGVRLCVDYKVGVNERLQDPHYPIRKIDDILNINEQSSEIQAISTHCGTYRLHLLSFGIKTAPSEFNRISDQILHDVTKTMSYFHDIIVHGWTREECQHNLIVCLDQFDLHLNQQKCSLFQEQIEYLGHVIEFSKISKSPGKVTAIVDMPRPKSTEDVRRFLGMVTYYSRFIHGASTITTPLRRLLCKNAIFKWTSACEAAILNLKQAIASDQVLVPYDPDLPVQLACDASATGNAGLDREALAIVFTVDHFFQYQFGHHFKLVTDNQLLTRIFNLRAALPKMTAGRFQRYAAFLSGCEPTIYWKKIDSDIEHLIRSCSECVAIKNSPAKAPSQHWEEPERNRQLIHIDYASPYQDYHFLVSVDAKSKWAEIVPCSSAPTSKSSIKILKDIFSRNGFPEVMKSDNATIFTSEEFAQFCREAGIFQKFCAAGHPATNGLAERNVQTLKHRLATMSNQNMPIHQKVWEILFRYRVTPLSNGKSPAEQYLNRPIRIQLDAMRLIKCHESPAPTQPACQFSEGERISARYYLNNKAHWKCGKVLKKLGNLHYLVELDNGFHSMDDHQLNKPNPGDLTEIMDPDVVLPKAEQPCPIEQEEEISVVKFQPAE
ncbi:hypothetical protein PR048_003811 [Dryococelus australis]|uniref:Integrase catalytic domain-containing protein n=1 Tax=Dryococelus australis TaxID=614101 RepID=A0ABQ9IP83_9NEOP|nr:hypothetical protein PR048_003811 [Dryococelus australis]